MGLSLSEIEEKAQELSGRLLQAGAAEAALISLQVEGLRNLAQILMVGDARIARTAELEIKQQALAVMGEQRIGPCHAEAPMGRVGGGVIFCQLQAGHPGGHLSDDENGRAAWPADESAEPTKPAADRLHELVSYCRTQADLAFQDAERQREASGLTGRAFSGDTAKDAYEDAADKLQDILTEGGI